MLYSLLLFLIGWLSISRYVVAKRKQKVRFNEGSLEDMPNLHLLTYQKILEELAASHGCLPPPMLQNQRPLGVDRLEQIFRADAESRLMELFLFHFRQTGYTLQQVFLRTPAFGTVDPANLEAIFSTKFKGKSFIQNK